jgi:flotillin
LEHFDNLVESSAKAISNIKFDKVIVWENGGENGKSSTAGFLQSMVRSLPPMMQVLRDIGGVELPEAILKVAGDGTPNYQENGTASAKESPLATVEKAKETNGIGHG